MNILLGIGPCTIEYENLWASTGFPASWNLPYPLSDFDAVQTQH